MKEPLLQYEIKVDQPLTPAKIARAILINTGVMAASYSYSMLLLIVTYMINQLKDANGSNTLYMAGGTLTITILDTCVVVSVSGAFLLGYFGTEIFSAIQLVRKELVQAPQSINNTKQDELDRLISQMQNLPSNAMKLAAPFITVSSLFMLSSKYIFEVSGQDPEMLDLIQWPLMMGAISLPIYAIRFSLEKMLLSAKKQRFVTALSLFDMGVFGVIPAYVLGFGKWGFPNLKMIGIFIGMLLENIVTTLGSMAGLHFMKDFEGINFRKNFCKRAERAELRFLFKTAFPIIFTIFSEWSASVVRNHYAGKIGTDQLAAQNFTTQLCFLIFLIAMALGEAIGLGLKEVSKIVAEWLKISKEEAKDHIETLKGQANYGKVGLFLGIIITGIISAFTSYQPDILIQFLAPNASPTVQQLGNNILQKYVGPNAFLYGMAIVMKQSVIAKNNGLWPSVDYNLAIWAGVLASGLQVFGDDLEGIVRGQILGTGLALLALLPAVIKSFFTKTPDQYPKPADSVGYGYVKSLANSLWGKIKSNIWQTPEAGEAHTATP
ncbi:MAG: hypothetical protein JSR33_07480 [Proteobacteria bacterium]|nr:hypothetical protein [Pseudomonadota bacterium]